jgi:RNA polymerase sigma-70 factor (ECF subfamily)
MATDRELSDFLEDVERRAFKSAVFAVKKPEAALDIVQDAMLSLAEKYGDRPAAELAPLFHRILHNRILDYFRSEKKQAGWISLFSIGNSDEGEESYDLLDKLQVQQDGQQAGSADTQLERVQILGIIEEEIEKLPSRQREAFLLRYWEELDVTDTAAAMACSEGSVKTHCSRANQALAAALKARGITL